MITARRHRDVTRRMDEYPEELALNSNSSLVVTDSRLEDILGSLVIRIDAVRSDHENDQSSSSDSAPVGSFLESKKPATRKSLANAKLEAVGIENAPVKFEIRSKHL